MTIKQCVRCGVSFECEFRYSGRRKYCDDCAIIERKERKRQAQRSYYEKQIAESMIKDEDLHKYGKSPYQVIEDPDDSWGRMSCLNRAEIVDLKRMGYLAEGTVFQHRKSGAKIVVKMTDKGLELVLLHQ